MSQALQMLCDANDNIRENKMKTRTYCKRSYYKSLVCPRKATAAEINKRYHLLQRYFNLNKVSTLSYRVDSLQLSREEVDRAYTVLGDANNRAEYDKQLAKDASYFDELSS